MPIDEILLVCHECETTEGFDRKAFACLVTFDGVGIFTWCEVCEEETAHRTQNIKIDAIPRWLKEAV